MKQFLLLLTFLIVTAASAQTSMPPKSYLDNLLKVSRPQNLPTGDLKVHAKGKINMIKFENQKVDTIEIISINQENTMPSKKILKDSVNYLVLSNKDSTVFLNKTESWNTPQYVYNPPNVLGSFPYFPIGANGLIVLNWISNQGNISTISCSGTIIDHFTLITAGHCMQTSDGHIIQDVYGNLGYFFPAYDLELANQPFGAFPIIASFGFSPWLINGDYDWDVAAMRTSHNASMLNSVGGGYEFGSKKNININEFSQIFQNFSYPGSDDDGNPYDANFTPGQKMVYRKGSFDYLENGSNNTMCSYSKGWHGQSGSSAYQNWTNLNWGRIIYAILSHGINKQGFQPILCFCALTPTIVSGINNHVIMGIEKPKIASTRPSFTYGFLNSESLHIDFQEDGHKIICIYDIIGRKLFERETNQTELEIRLPSNVQMAVGVIQTEKYQQSIKIIKP